MLAGNVSGREPTLFNGGPFTFDPLYVNGKKGPATLPTIGNGERRSRLRTSDSFIARC